MFRFVKYALFFLVGYRILKLLFGEFAGSSPTQNDRKIGDISVSNSHSPEKSTSRTDVEPEYIDYEEVK